MYAIINPLAKSAFIRKVYLICGFAFGFKDNDRIHSLFQQRRRQIQPLLRTYIPETSQIKSVYKSTALAKSVQLKERITKFIGFKFKSEKCRNALGISLIKA